MPGPSSISLRSTGSTVANCGRPTGRQPTRSWSPICCRDRTARFRGYGGGRRGLVPGEGIWPDRAVARRSNRGAATPAGERPGLRPGGFRGPPVLPDGFVSQAQQLWRTAASSGALPVAEFCTTLCIQDPGQVVASSQYAFHVRLDDGVARLARNDGTPGTPGAASPAASLQTSRSGTIGCTSERAASAATDALLD